MNPAYAAYNVIGTGLFLSLVPSFLLYTRLTGKYRLQMAQRFGQYSEHTLQGIQGSPRIWIHAVSVGEVTAASAIIEDLKEAFPKSAIILSTLTEHGYQVARKRYHSRATCILAPIDTVFSTRRAIRRIQPDILVLMETELWPVWLREASRRGIPVALVNGRLSVRSYSGYLKIRPLMRSAFVNIDVFSMISPGDAARIRSLGAAPARIRIHGNAKYDGLFHGVSDHTREDMRRLFDLDGSEPVFVAGSTRRNEDDLVVGAFRQIQRSVEGSVLILAPRHLPKLPAIEEMLKKKGLAYQLRSDLDRPGSRRAPVVLLDTMGELFSVYSIATVVFCGGSLVPLGGQNVLEPAAWGKPVVYGPSMEDFLDAGRLLERSGGGVQVTDAAALAEEVRRLLTDRAEAERMGRRAYRAASRNRGAAARHAEEITKLLAV